MPSPTWCSYAYSPSSDTDFQIRQLPRSGSAKDSLKLSAVVVTMRNGNSYDPVFHEIPQEGVEGTYVATYEVVGRIKPLLTALQGTLAPGDLGTLMQDIASVDPSAVVFNWECCCGCSTHSFGCTPQNTLDVIEVISLAIARGHMAMCSDFSLKALIGQWSADRFGPNPFVMIGEFGGSMQLKFDAARIAECPSAQLQRAGELCEHGCATVKALGSTIAYTIDKRAAREAASTQRYHLEVLTIATEMPGIDLAHLPQERTCDAGGQKGAAGHVMLRYPSGGILLVSAGHWIELVRLDGVSEERLLQAAANQYGAAYSANWSAQIASAPDQATREQRVQNFASQMVNQSVPCTYSMRM